MSFDTLIAAIAKKQNPTVVGLDPSLDKIPEYLKYKAYDKHGESLKGAVKAMLDFNKGIIDAIYDIVPAVKPQSAYYEMYGPAGVKVLLKTQDYAKKRGMYVITDGKRNDIGTTAEAYSSAYLGQVRVGENMFSPFSSDALTVNGYLGTDGIMPFIKSCNDGNKGIFVLVKTSNPSSGELQDKLIDGKPVYMHMADLCKKWGESAPGKYGYNGVGVVVGATYPEQLEEIRKNYPETFILVPGYGAQGGNAEGAAKAFDDHGLGAIVNNSRGILYAYKDEKCDERDFAGAARRAAVKMRDELIAEIGSIKLR